jgi:uncharacterized protein
MHRYPDGTIVVSATDLVGYLECDHLATLELGHATGLWERPHHRKDPELELLRERGLEHERRFLDARIAIGSSVADFPDRPENSLEAIRAARDATVDAMRTGAEVIYQATLFNGRWVGYADFLLRVERPSELGSWSYEVADTKLARAVKGSAILQVCVYSDLLAAMQGVAPEAIHVVTGDRVQHSLRLDDFAAYHRAAKRRFEREVFGDGDLPARDPATAETYPDPVDHCKVCTWYPVCIERRRADDHLSMVAGMTHAVTKRLVSDDVATRRALARLPRDRSVQEVNPRTLARLREQARVQVEGEARGELIFELIDPDPAQPDHGLARLPEPSPNDVFFDIEADPWAEDDELGFGLEYLLGVVTVEGGSAAYQAFWAHDRDGERAAFEAFIDMVVERRAGDPTMHVYHYGGYESGAVKRLMQRHATREEEVDQLLRDQVFVDLLNVVRQGIRASVDSYSIKRIEKFYMSDRTGPVTEAGFSVVEYEAWRRDGEQRHLDGLAAYNKDDCVSTWLLRDWLEDRRREGLARGWDLPRPVPPKPELPEELTRKLAETRRREQALREGISEDPAKRSETDQGRWLLSRLVDWHRREDKPGYWNFKRLQEMSIEELIGESDALAGLEPAGATEPDINGTVVERYTFPAQDHKLRAPRKGVIDPEGDDWGVVTGDVLMVDDLARTIELRRTKGMRAKSTPDALLWDKPFFNASLKEAIGRVADWVIDNDIDAPGDYRAGRDLLLRRPPRRPESIDAAPLVRPGESRLEAAVRLGGELDHGTLAIQGPPGTGKTWTGAHMALGLIVQGKKVGITAQSHRAIGNFLEQLDEVADANGRSVRIAQACDTGEHPSGLRADHRLEDDPVHGKAHVPAQLTDGAQVAAGTAWLFTRPTMRDAVDVLFVDEAGQMSLANVVAMSGSTRSIVLLGDPNQLAQVTQGVHPDGADASALGHAIGANTIIDPSHGLLLDRTFRMHPAVNDYVSKTFYAGAVESDVSTHGQAVAAGEPGGFGIRLSAVTHAGNESRSVEEVDVVIDALAALLGRPWTNQRGETRPLTLGDLIVVAPYNLQVAAIRAASLARFGHEANAGTVDKFQGREGAVAIYSMTSSTAEDAPRGMDFLYERNRLNVAISRARALAILVASPELLRVHCRTPEQMRKANALCAYVEIAAGSGAGGEGTTLNP